MLTRDDDNMPPCPTCGHGPLDHLTSYQRGLCSGYDLGRFDRRDTSGPAGEWFHSSPCPQHPGDEGCWIFCPDGCFCQLHIPLGCARTAA